MNVFSTKGWDDYQLLDSGLGMRLERFGEYVIAKPDPQAIWNRSKSKDTWSQADATYEFGAWNKKNNIPDKWLLSYKDIKFYAKLTAFKHTGIFPEQSLNWDFIEEKIKSSTKRANVLNLFAYTGIASLIAAKNNAQVTHLDASKSSIAWAKENQAASNLPPESIRWILDDALEFTAREARRGNTYDAIIMDPPVYGHGPSKEVWDFNKSFPILLQNCFKILSKSPIFIIVNAYAISASSLMLNNLLEDCFASSHIEYGELALEQSNKRLLSTGIFARLY